MLISSHPYGVFIQNIEPVRKKVGLTFRGRFTLNNHVRGWGEQEENAEEAKLLMLYVGPVNGIAAEERLCLGESR